jgi:hypothetical protein
MTRIAAANNLTIEYDQDYWRLITNGGGTDHVLVEAAAGKPLAYMPTFGSRRRLPDTGKLPTQYIQRVVLGWSGKDRSWHLGLMLEPELAEARGSRWCEIAHWHDPQRELYASLASSAGEHLAQTITRPFNFIPAREDQPDELPPVVRVSRATDTAETRAAVQAAPLPRAAAPHRAADYLPALPLKLDLWTLKRRDDNRLELTLAGSWARARLTRILWYTLWTAVYIVLSITTLRAGIALPNPAWLPYLGLASAVVLVLLIFVLFYQLITTPNRLLIEPSARAVIAMSGKTVRWRVDDIASVYVSQVASRRARRGKRTLHYGELNLLRQNGKFRHLIENGHNEERDTDFELNPVEEGVMEITADRVDSTMIGAGYYIAQMLGVRCYLDQRLK